MDATPRNQDVAGLFFARSVDLYLKDGGVIGMVLPHSALQAGQYAKWRTGTWESAASEDGDATGLRGGRWPLNFGRKAAWDLEKLEPNTFFPIASCVAFAERVGENTRMGRRWPASVERWEGADRRRRRAAGVQRDY